MKIYDCFIFFNELDILDLRLNILDPYVDKFVITEATHTFSGNEKPLVYQENISRFDKFQDKIIHNIVDMSPTHINNMQENVPGQHSQYADCWKRETRQRNAMICGLELFADLSDIVLLSDVDEVVNPNLLIDQIPFLNRSNFLRFEMLAHYYYLNLQFQEHGTSPFMHGPSACLYEMLVNRKQTPQSLRNFALGTRIVDKKIHYDSVEPHTVYNGGWHWSYLGDENFIKNKIKAFSHQEFNNDVVLSRVSKNVENFSDLFGREAKFTKCDIDETYPTYIIDNLDSLSHLVL